MVQGGGRSWRPTRPRASERARAATTLVADERQSRITVTVTTALGGFQVEGLGVSGQVALAASSAAFDIATGKATTKNRVRDRHLHDGLLRELGTIAVLLRLPRSSDWWRDAARRRKLEIPAVVKVGDRESEVTLEARLSLEGVSWRASLDLTTFGLVMPQFLGLTVSPVVQVEGFVVWSRPRPSVNSRFERGCAGLERHPWRHEGPACWSFGLCR
jgi:hypothetical protein